VDLLSALRHAMRRRRNPRISSADLDRLLSGGSPDPGQVGLAALLDAARAPATPGELAGERAAVAAFVAAHRSTAPTGTPKRRNRVRISSLARAATMKAAAGVAVLAVGGTAAAAGTGSLPRDVQQQAHSWFSGLGVPPPAPQSPPSTAPSAGADPTSGPSAPSGGAPSARPGSAAPPPGSAGPVPPVPQARGLCRAWQVADGKKNGKPMKAGSRRELAALAGDEAKIPAFCAPYIAGPSAPPVPTPDVSTSPVPPGQDKDKGKPGGKDAARSPAGPPG
jgi:hypothetical protein